MEKKNPSMSLHANVEKKYFVANKDTGEQKRYYEFYTILDGVVVRLYPAKDKKQLVNYVLDKNADKFKE